MSEDLFKKYSTELFRTYSSEDFVNDSLFRRLILNEKESLKNIRDLIEELPGKKQDILMACSIIKGLKSPALIQSDLKKNAQWENIITNDKRRKKKIILKYAASMIIIVCIGASVLFSTFLKHASRVYVASSVPVYENATLILENGAEVVLSRGSDPVIEYSTDGASLVVNDSLTLDRGINYGINKVIVPYGKRSSLTLSDGTKVWLNSGSALSFNPVFKGRTREVNLEGEGYFEVAKNPAMPFIVHTDSFDIKAVGTSFNIKSYEGDDIVSTTLVEGKVSLKFKGQSLSNEFFLNPQQKASITRGNNAIVISSEESIENTISWINGYYSFNNAEMEDVLKMVSKYYNINIELKYRTKLTNIYGKLDLKENPENVMEVLAILSGTRYSKEDDRYLFIN